MLRIPAVAFVGAALISGAPLAAEVVETRADGFVTRDVAHVAATPLETWLALIKPGDWWNDGHTWSGDASNMTITPQGGGCFCEKMPGEDSSGGFQLEGSVQHAVVLQAFPMKVLRMRGGLGPLQGEPATGIITITLKEVDGGTRVLWEYNVGGAMRYPIGDIAPTVDGVMRQQLHGLRDHLGALSGYEQDEATGAAAAEDDSGDPAATQEEPSLEAQIDALVADDD